MSAGPADSLHRALEASFSLESLVCNLFGSDVAAPRADGLSSPVDVAYAAFLAAQARAGRDSMLMVPYPTDLSAESEANLFHERVHYWQFVSTPMRQHGFMYRLMALKESVRELGGAHANVAGAAFDTAAELAGLVADDDHTFLPFDLDPSMVRGSNQVAHELETHMLFYMRQVGRLAYPGYAALMRLREGAALFPFSGKSIMECAAHVSELLFRGAPLPRLESMDDPQGPLYLGPWEFWARVHGERYPDERQLAVAFLVVADATLVTDAYETELLDSESWGEERSYAYRFGKLVFRLQGADPLSLDGADPAAAITAFRDAVYRHAGALPRPDLSVKKMMVAITRQLVMTVDSLPVDLPLEVDWVVDRLFGPARQLVDEHWAELEDVWRLLDREVLPQLPSVVGLRTLCTMLNACQVRLDAPAWLAVPHLFADELSTRLPMPLLLRDGTYHWDRGAFAHDSAAPAPLRVQAADLAFDSLALLCLGPIRDGERGCGFIREYVACSHILSGLGCPVQGLTPGQREARDAVGLGTECHWTHHSRGVGLDPS